MAKNVEESKNALKEYFAANPQGGWSNDMGRIPLSAGDVITLNGKVEKQKSTAIGMPDWMALLTDEGFPISLRQLARRGNGLEYPTEIQTSEQALFYLLDKIATTEKGLSLKVRENRKMQNAQGRVSSYLLFESVEL